MWSIKRRNRPERAARSRKTLTVFRKKEIKKNAPTRIKRSTINRK